MSPISYYKNYIKRRSDFNSLKAKSYLIMNLVERLVELMCNNKGSKNN